MFKKLLLPLLLLTNYSFSQWFPQPSGVTTNLNSVFFLNSGYGFIVGNSGMFMKTTNGGMNWDSFILSLTDDYNDVCFINSDEGTIVGNVGLILRTTDGGLSWDTIASGVTDNLYSVSFSGMNGIIGGSSQTILYSTDGGASWNISQSGFFGGGFSGAYMLNSNIGFVAGQNSIFQPFVAKSTDGGITWEFFNFYFNSNEGSCSDIFFFDENNGIVTGIVWDGQGAISRTTNGGTDWNSSLVTNPILGIDFTTNYIGFAVGYSGTILTTTNGGISWSQQASGTSSNLNEVDFFGDALNGVAVGEGGLILATNNGGIPVELTSFTALLDGNKVNLNWSTATETNNLGFEVERSQMSEVKSQRWEKIGFVEGYGTTTQQQLYSFIDYISEFSSGVISYRLKQIDFDGSFEYSKPIEINYNSAPKDFSLFQNYPNPFNPTTEIQYQIPQDGFVTLKIYDILGNEVKTLVNKPQSVGGYTIKFDASDFASGTYVYRMKVNDFISTKKMILLK